MHYSYLILSFSMWFICFVQCVSVAKPFPHMYFSLHIHLPRQAMRLNHCVVSSSFPKSPCVTLWQTEIVSPACDYTLNYCSRSYCAWMKSLRVWSIRSWPQGQANQSAVTLSLSSLISGSCVFVFSVWLLQHWRSLYLLDTERLLWWERCSSVCCWTGLCFGWVLLDSLCIWTSTCLVFI